MSIMAINGSPRKNGNTAAMLQHAMKGAESAGATTELVHLYDLDFKGCVSCFACKLRDRKGPVRCAIKDELAPILEKSWDADAIVIGSPIYIGEMTSSARAFVERFIFPYVSYNDGPFSLFDKKISVGLIFTMGAPEARARQMGFDHVPTLTGNIFQALSGSVETVVSFDTLQFDDYTKYAASKFDPVEKKRINEERFPVDCAKAFDMGVRFVKASSV